MLRPAAGPRSLRSAIGCSRAAGPAPASRPHLRRSSVRRRSNCGVRGRLVLISLAVAVLGPARSSPPVPARPRRRARLDHGPPAATRPTVVATPRSPAWSTATRSTSSSRRPATRTVRLLGIDTPETVKPDQAGAVLRQGGSDHTAALLPPGTAVRLERDVEARDATAGCSPTSTGERRPVRQPRRSCSEGYARILHDPPNVAHGAELARRDRRPRPAPPGCGPTCGGRVGRRVQSVASCRDRRSPNASATPPTTAC